MPVTSRPNILVINTDQHRFDALSFRGHSHVQTPNLDKLLERSVRFDCAYTQAPVCAPARYTMATGQYVPAHGVRFNNINPTQPVRTIAHRMKEAGYRRFQIGHMHWSPETTDTGYEPQITRQDWIDTLSDTDRARVCWEHDTLARTMTGGPSPIAEENFWGHFVAKRAIDLMGEAVDNNEPFFCWCSIFEPHPPFYPPKEVYTRFNQSEIALPPEAPGDATPPGERMLQRRKKWSHLTDVEIRQMMAGYYGMVEVADRCAGKVLDFLEERNLLENTWILWTSDHGEQLYAHEMFLKFCMYEESVHVSFAISGPGVQAGTRDALVEHTDIYPTLCELAGLRPEPELPGRSLLPMLESAETPNSWREAVFSHINDVQMVRTKDAKLVTYGSEPVELYDLNKDPSEFYNLISDPDYTQVRETLTTYLRETFTQTSIHNQS